MAGVDVGTAYLSIVPSAKGFAGKLQGELGSGMAKSGKSAGVSYAKGMSGGVLPGLKKMAGLAAASLAAAGIGSFFKDTIAGASDLNESTSKVGVVFGRQSAQIVAASKSAASAMGLSQNAYLAATGTLGNLLVSLKIAPKAAAGMSTQMVKLAGDLASFNNVSPEDALAAIKSGLTGETEPLKQFGVNMNDATLKAQALKMGLIKSTKDALNPQTKALAAQALIMDQTKTAQGDFARTSGGLANQQRILTARVDDFKAGLGKGLLPIATKVVTFLSDKMLPGIQGVIDILFKGDFTKEFGKAFNISEDSGIVDFLFNVREGVQRFAEYIKTDVVPAVKNFITEFQNGEGAGGKFRDILGTIRDAIVTVVTDGVRLVKFLNEHRTAVVAATAAVVALVAITKIHSAVMAVQAAGGIIKMIQSTKLVTTVTKTWTAVQWLMNAALTANPIGLVIVAIAALAAGLIYAYKHSEKFRTICQLAFQGVAMTGRWLWNNALAPVIRFLLNGFSSVARSVATLLHALGNVPGFGWAETAAKKLDGAANKAHELAKSIKDIPAQKIINVDIYARTRQSGRIELPNGQSLNVGMREHGGPVRAGQPYIVGERRPELFVPSSNGRIVPQVPTGGGGLSQADVLRIAGAMSQVQLQTTVSAGSFDRQMGARL